MRLILAVLLSLAAFAAEAPPAPTKEQARIAQLEQALAAGNRALALEEVRTAAARLEILQKAQADFRKAHQRACELFGIPIAECGWNGDTVTRPAPQTAQSTGPATTSGDNSPANTGTIGKQTTVAAKPAPVAKGK